MKKIWHWALWWHLQWKFTALKKEEEEEKEEVEKILTIITSTSHEDLCQSQSVLEANGHDLISMCNLQNLFTEVENQVLAGGEMGQCSSKDKHFQSQDCLRVLLL